MFQILDSDNIDEFHFSLIEEAMRQEELLLQAEVYEEIPKLNFLQGCENEH